MDAALNKMQLILDQVATDVLQEKTTDQSTSLKEVDNTRVITLHSGEGSFPWYRG